MNSWTERAEDGSPSAPTEPAAADPVRTAATARFQTTIPAITLPATT